MEPTSGSSGKVLHIYHSQAAFDTYFSFVFRHLSSLGYRPWQRVAYTAFDPLVSLPWERLGLGVRQQVDLRSRDARTFLNELIAINPQLITAFPSILLMIIRVATSAELRRIRPQAIHLHSELLTDGIRDTIRMAFDCDCFDDYSTIEFHHVATECRHHRYHTAADNVILEVVRDGQPVAPGEEGEIVITGLTNQAMPLIRYAIGDVGVAGVSERCGCGSSFPTMELVQGRVDDFIVLPSGRRLSPRIVNPAIELIPGILEHVLIQEARDHVVVQLHVAEGYRDSLPQQVAFALRSLFGEPMRIEVMLDQDLERGRTGKLRSIISKVHRSASHLDQVPALHQSYGEVH
ncbi:MAG: phenylacetate--CoA ligase family protein, partial [Herpetosiphonaceae bacterium]|nr:phenylacetate--CoA ligase family protein [Herpetosiphonaceae bacterium]